MSSDGLVVAASGQNPKWPHHSEFLVQYIVWGSADIVVFVATQIPEAGFEPVAR
jgi:hypothetical protein